MPSARYRKAESRAEAKRSSAAPGSPQGSTGSWTVPIAGAGAPHRHERSPSLDEIRAAVATVFDRAGIETLDGPEAVDAALARIRNVLAELGALYLALGRLPAGSAVTVVHDYDGVGAWLTARWRTKDPTARSVVDACRSPSGASPSPSVISAGTSPSLRTGTSSQPGTTGLMRFHQPGGGRITEAPIRERARGRIHPPLPPSRRDEAIFRTGRRVSQAASTGQPRAARGQ